MKEEFRIYRELSFSKTQREFQARRTERGRELPFGGSSIKKRELAKEIREIVRLFVMFRDTLFWS